MKILIVADIEGVAGVNAGLQGTPGNAEYERARRLMTNEASAAIRGAIAGGATMVTVADSHGPMRNIIAEDLDPRARLIAGKPRPLTMVDGVTPEHAGVILIGHHAAADDYGVLSHTISGAAFRRIEVNGILAGEPTLFGGYAAEIGVPLLAVSGDDRLEQHVKQQFPAAATITVKTCIGAAASDSLSPDAACRLIETEVCKAVKTAPAAKAVAPCQAPFVVDAQLMHQMQADAAVLLPSITRTGPRDIRFTVESHRDIIGTLAGLALMSSAVMA